MIQAFSVYTSQYRLPLVVLVQDVKPLEVYGVAYLVDNTSLCFVVSDRLQNLIVYTYQPEIRESFGGQRLLRRADFHLGHKVNTTDRKAGPACERCRGRAALSRSRCGTLVARKGLRCPSREDWISLGRAFFRAFLRER